MKTDVGPMIEKVSIITPHPIASPNCGGFGFRGRGMAEESVTFFDQGPCIRHHCSLSDHLIGEARIGSII